MHQSYSFGKINDLDIGTMLTKLESWYQIIKTDVDKIVFVYAMAILHTYLFRFVGNLLIYMIYAVWYRQTMDNLNNPNKFPAEYKMRS